jgi:hypothetical protein
MSMTKKDYEAIAAIIRREMGISRDMGRADALGALRVVANEIAHHCKRNSTSFQPERFINACLVQQ